MHTDRHLKKAIELLDTVEVKEVAVPEIQPLPKLTKAASHDKPGVSNDVQATGVRSSDQHWIDLSEAARKLLNNLHLVRRYELLGEEFLSEIILSEEDAKKLQAIDTFLEQCLFDHVRNELQELAHVQNWGSAPVEGNHWRNPSSFISNRMGATSYRNLHSLSLKLVTMT